MNARIARQGRLILNVEDREGPRYVKSSILQRAGFSVLEASTGQAALSLVRQHTPALVLLALRLPDISGLEVCKLLKSDPNLASTPILLTSPALATSAQRVEALDCGADNFMVEPSEPEELIASIQSLLRLRRAEDAYHRTSQALHDNEDMFRQLAESLVDVVWLLDARERRLLFVSPRLSELCGQTPEKVMEDPTCCLDRVVPADRARVASAVASMLQDGKLDIEFQFMHADGGIREVLARAFPMRCTGNETLRVAGTCQDVTTQNRARRALRGEERRKEQFLAMLAHELRNPLAPMRSAVDLLQQPQPAPADAFRARDVIGRQLRHLSQLVDDLLDISRFNQGRITLRQDLVELRGALNTAVETVRPVMEAQQHTLRLSLPEQPLPVRGDMVRLTQIFSNLLHNAAAYTPAGGQIRLDATVTDGRVDVRVHDNGMGLTGTLQRLLFDPLAPEEPGSASVAGARHADDGADTGGAQSYTPEGPGIGLTLVQQLVRLHGGRIRAESPGPGEGSTFIVELPVEPWQNWHPAETMVPRPSGPPRVIMLVDDNTDALEAMSMTLRMLGHTVVTAPDGPSAVARAPEVKPEVVLLDLGMPAMDGFETARRLRALPEMRGATLVALTGYGQPEDRRRALEAGFDRHLVKPASLEALTRLFEEQGS
ncbi:hybrid sensor histidine kinase/response regulator [Cupriavidus pinatubonensis]|uniref:histidine kinase n=1 Tax=Cupriavidus pinatubonensis TaxID=248026 RepID=A0ABM8XFP0_9BURK|nr:response regulator [Cupriavidus pinatubonensis]CAG9178955.1 Sensor histidine kinase RcsC [Cupriavidus pinatubonensis]